MTPSLNTEVILPREAYTLLAQANLLRMRGRWEESVDACMAALRLAPESATAQSLLGDIYENQGRMDDAIQWYRMALDVNPDSPADKLKLDRLLNTKQQQLAAAHFPAEFTPISPRSSLPVVVRAPERLLRWGAWLVVGLTVLVVVLTGAAMSVHRPGTHSATITAPTIVVGGPAPSPPVASPILPNTNSAAAADPAEQGLLQALQADPQLAAQNLIPVGIQMDPRQSAVTLTLLCPQPADPSVREGLLRDSVAGLLAAVRAQGDPVPAWTIRCLLAAPAVGAGASPPPARLALVADTTPAALSSLGADPSSLTAVQIQPAFHDLWWSPSISQ